MPVYVGDKKIVNIISCGVSWIDMRIVFGPDSKYSRMWIGVCHFEDRVYMWTPMDYQKPLMITSIDISPTEGYCEHAHSCVNFKCKLNKFKKEKFIDKFKDLGTESLGLPQDFGTKDLWFNDPNSKWYLFWSKLLYINKMKPEGGRLEYSEEKYQAYSEGKFV